MVKIAVNGGLGRMGTRIIALAKEQPKRFKITHVFDLKKHADMPAHDGTRIEDLKPYMVGEEKLNCDVLIDFSGPDGARGCVSAAKASGKALVIGSTGLDDDSLKTIQTAAAKVPVVLSSNMGVGINAILSVLGLLGKSLPKDFDIEITEAHHRHKKDAPSGTALMLAKAIAEAKGWDLKKVLKERHHGVTGERESEEIGMQVIRAGEIVGEHTVLFAGPSETIEITHRASSRDAFARGALLAAEFAAKAKPRLYSMQDVLG